MDGECEAPITVLVFLPALHRMGDAPSLASSLGIVAGPNSLWELFPLKVGPGSDFPSSTGAGDGFAPEKLESSDNCQGKKDIHYA